MFKVASVYVCTAVEIGKGQTIYSISILKETFGAVILRESSLSHADSIQYY
jgi:hypothetical protein